MDNGSQRAKTRTAATPVSRLALAALAALAAWAAVALWPPSRLAPVPANAPADQFSTGRAMAHVEAIARAPHPPGSPDHDRVRDSIRGEFAKLGLQTEVQAGIGRRPLRHREGSVENILARLPETANTRPLMLACHYDSVPMGPGPATMRTPWRS